MKELTVLLLAACASASGAHAAPPVRFNWFEYTGRDRVFEAPLAPGEYRNPILAGFYPDPNVCRVGDDYYLVNSSFAYFPGIPVFHSRDLVHWTQLGNAIDRPSQFNYDGLGVSRGIFAPSISHRDGRFYLVCTFIDGGGNFLMTAADPAGPWSDPVWLDIDGIDPSLFFDDDGRAWLVSNGPPPDNQPLYPGHRAIWIQQFDARAQRLAGPRRIIVNGGSDLQRHPVWIEGPHLFRKDGWYYLICAEGGTAEGHSEVVFRSKSLAGPFEPGAMNPILTQRDLPESRSDPVTCAGHASLVQTPQGDWWAVFLGCRPYADNLYDTGRETFLAAASWRDGWPVILPHGEPVPYVARGPRGGTAEKEPVPLTGNFTWRDTFDAPGLSPLWLMLRRPKETWWSLGGPRGHLLLTPRDAALSGTGNPSFLGRRVQHARFEASEELDVPTAPGVSAGLAVFQNEAHYFLLNVRAASPGFLVSVHRSEESPGNTDTLVRSVLLPATDKIRLRIAGDGAFLKFEYATHDTWISLAGGDAPFLSTKTAGGFVGSTVGPYAQLTP